MGGRLDAEQILRSGSDAGSSGGYLRGKRLTDYFEGSERPAFVLSNETKGIKHERGGETAVVTPGEDYQAVAAVTNERVLLVVGGNDERGGRNREVSLPYTEIRSIETKTGVFKSRLTITARTSDTYHFVLSGREALDEVEAYVERAIAYWVAVDRRLEKARDHLSTIESTIEAGDPRAAADAYRRTQELLDQASEVAEAFESGTRAMERRIDQLETRLTLTEIRGHRLRGRQLAETATDARGEDDYEAALDAYTTAKSQYERAVDLAAASQNRDAEKLRSELTDVSKAVEEIRTEPLLRAMNACAEAIQADEPAPERWRTAIDVCHDVHGILHRDDRFDGDPAALRFQIEWLVQNCLNAHERAAEQAVRAGEEYREQGDDEAGRNAFERAREHLRRARDLAREFRSGVPARYETALETVYQAA
ncbi:PH domain-containing protein [Halorientalis brevis]|uniref:PH domain-containing protein n=1 Tax=Halorientalis brevis TaxID=1126241 RepID=A0ABD6C7V7_9EURY|nr:PH domain-containing protein [Halorientalis brevis]